MSYNQQRTDLWAPDSAKQRLLVAKRLTPSISRRVCNFRHASKRLHLRAPADRTCPCRQYPLQCRPGGVCVLTVDTPITGHPSLTAVVDKGTIYRAHRAVNPANILGLALDDCIDRTVRRLRVPREQWGPCVAHSCPRPGENTPAYRPSQPAAPSGATRCPSPRQPPKTPPGHGAHG